VNNKPTSDKIETIFNEKNENKKNKTEIKEQDYQNAIALMNSIHCMTACADKVEMYHEAEVKFFVLSGYKDSEEYVRECKRLMLQTTKEMKQRIYKRAKFIKNNAKLSADYKDAANEFRRISGYKDSDEMADKCDQLRQGMNNRSLRKKLVSMGIVVLSLAVLGLGASTSHAKYYLANAYQATTVYSPAIKMYKKLNGYKDSEDRLIECQYLKGIDLKEKGNYKDAAKAFAASENYKNSDEEKVKMEQFEIIESEPGDKVKIGEYDWTILKIEKNQALLVKKTALPETEYNENIGNITWEESTIRQWLNKNFMEETFSEAEKNNIILSNVVNEDNAVYGTDGGNDTQDQLFLLSIDEVKEYTTLFPTYTSNSWLRSPGANPSCVAFLSVNGAVMDYGYPANSDEITVRPAMFFSIES
jgi:tetratricopeptide (TPR) repeat protein